MKEDWVKALAGVPALLIAWLARRNKQRADQKRAEMESLRELLSIWREEAGDLRTEAQSLRQELRESLKREMDLQQRVQQLEAQVKELTTLINERQHEN